MDSVSAFDAFAADDSAGSAGVDPILDEIGNDERRMHVRAYNYWAGLLEGRDFPSIEDLEPDSVVDFAPHSVLLDFTAGRDNPATPYIGSAIRVECDLSHDVKAIGDVPSRSLLSRLTDHYLQIIANRAPIGFEAEFVNQRGAPICYRGILMPFSSDGETIDFIYGVINWKRSAAEAEVQAALVPALAPLEPAVVAESNAESVPPPTHLSWEDGPLHDAKAEPGDVEEPLLLDETIVLDEDAGLADRLSAARDSAEVCKQQDGRSRAALYRTLALAYDFAVAARRATDDYAEILVDAGVKAQARAPMTPIVKLVFGIDYDKTRLTEFAAALGFAERSCVDFGEFLQFIERQPGGLKALVSAERQARRPAGTTSKLDLAAIAARQALRTRAALSLRDLPTNEEFALVVTRRNSDGIHEIVAMIADDKLLQQALRRSS
ncbi:MAG: hypothetical protein M3N02_05730 [Pseudomonadota bacterium]|nr:hypothetical protein [Pseudomonadota bacterium]